MKNILLYIITIILFLCGTFPHPLSPAKATNQAIQATAQTTTKVTTQATTQTPIQSNPKATTIPLSGSYACILNDNSYFYTLPDEKRGIFLLPKTYYVKVLDYQSDYCKIEYLYDDSNLRKLTGYARTSDLTFVEYVPKRPYLYYIFDVRYEMGDSHINDSSFLTQITVTCAYYGDFYLGTTAYCYVLRGDTFGYIPKPATLSYEENTEYADYLAQQTPPDSETPSKNTSSSPIQIAILITLCLLVPVLASLILKQPKRPFYYEPEEPIE